MRTDLDDAIRKARLASSKLKGAKYRLRDVCTQEVSAVDVGAVQRTFVIVKRDYSAVIAKAEQARTAQLRERCTNREKEDEHPRNGARCARSVIKQEVAPAARQRPEAVAHEEVIPMSKKNIASQHRDFQHPATVRADIWTPEFVAALQALHDPWWDGIDEPDVDDRPMRPAQRHAIAGALAELIIADLRRGAGGAL